MPGQLAKMIEPRLLAALTEGRRLVLVTGTNGKTSTTSMIVTLLQSAGHEVFSNASGANLEDGIISSLLEQKYALARAPSPYLVLEVDEAWFARLAPQLKPQFVVVTNFFRDQLDRYGEMDQCRNLIARGLEGLPQAKIILCADDSLSVSLSRGREEASFFFGIERKALSPFEAGRQSECCHCFFCGTRYDYEGVSYAHLGYFFCPACGFRHPQTDLSFFPLAEEREAQRLRFHYRGQSAELFLPMPGRHNQYNAAAALACALALDEDFVRSVESLGSSKISFGRMERVAVREGKEICIILAKNPVGMDETLRYLAMQDDLGALLFLLNDRSNDGRDISWIWDADFEALTRLTTEGTQPCVCSGTRAEDLALRLYYANFPEDKLQSERDLQLALDLGLSHCAPGRCLYVVPNYTAMLAVRKLILRRARGSDSSGNEEKI